MAKGRVDIINSPKKRFEEINSSLIDQINLSESILEKEEVEDKAFWLAKELNSGKPMQKLTAIKAVLKRH